MFLNQGKISPKVTSKQQKQAETSWFQAHNYSIIIKYSVDFENSKIIINTINENGERVDIIFENILTCAFENQQKNSIILDIEERTSKEFINDNIELLKRDYGWPIIFNNIEELNNTLETQKYKYYILQSSYGMYGWILATGLQEIKVVTEGRTKNI